MSRSQFARAMWPEDEVTSPVDKLADLINEDVAAVDAATPLAEVIELLVELRVPAVCVIDTAALVGVITRTDALRAAPGATAGEAMSTYVLALPGSATIGRAAALMAVERVGHVAVLGDDGGLLGLVSAFDVARHYAAVAGFGAL
jgi:CBS domain-containing protein